MDKRKVILDCDPGHDDAVNILLAGKSPVLDLIGITVVAGNQTLEKTTRNALNVCQYLGLDVPVYQGCGQPMIIEKRNSPEIHGETGLDGPTFDPLTKEKETKHAVNYLTETIMASDGEITLVPTGPLTNIGMAMRMEPAIIPKIKEIVLMGGSYQLGNVSPAAEFNILADADAAHVVFSSGVPIVMVGLDVTRKVLCYPSVVERMRAIDTRAAHLFADMMEFFNKTQKEVFGWEGGPLHDPVTCAYLIDPSVLEVKEMYTEIDHGFYGPSYGRTNCDYFGMSGKTPNTKVAVDIDVEKFWDIIEAGIRNYS
ncbi:MAG: nucleoside hydrolase [Clostridiales bacterium]|nr:nucleoside hydrolase [Clostridiales bacterium]